MSAQRADSRRVVESDDHMVSEKHYTIQDLVQLWSLSPQTIRRLFQREPEVICISTGVSVRKRRYTTLRIPESVAQRVHRRLRKAR